MPRSSGVQLHVTSLPAGRLGARGVHDSSTGSQPPGSRGGRCCRSGRPTATARRTRSRSAFAAWPGAARRDPRAPVSAPRSCSTSASATRSGSTTGSGSPAAARSPTRSASSANGARLRAYASERGVRLFGDVAIYVAPGSADHRAHPELFRDGLVAGAPPDAFSAQRAAVGQPAVRLAGAAPAPLSLVGRAAAARRSRCSISPGSTTSAASSPTGRCRRARATRRGGRWLRGPGRALFDALGRELGALPLVAEDLGVITPAGRAPARRARAARDGRAPVRLRRPTTAQPAPVREPRREPASSTPARTTTTRSRGWYESLDPERRDARRRRARRARIARTREPWWGLIRLALASPARLAMIQAQDVLGLGSDARMNDPARAGGNWRWRLERRALTPALARRLREATDEAGRL